MLDICECGNACHIGRNSKRVYSLLYNIFAVTVFLTFREEFQRLIGTQEQKRLKTPSSDNQRSQKRPQYVPEHNGGRYVADFKPPTQQPKQLLESHNKSNKSNAASHVSRSQQSETESCASDTNKDKYVTMTGSKIPDSKAVTQGQSHPRMAPHVTKTPVNQMHCSATRVVTETSSNSVCVTKPNPQRREVNSDSREYVVMTSKPKMATSPLPKERSDEYLPMNPSYEQEQKVKSTNMLHEKESSDPYLPMDPSYEQRLKVKSTDMLDEKESIPYLPMSPSYEQGQTVKSTTILPEEGSSDAYLPMHPRHSRGMSGKLDTANTHDSYNHWQQSVCLRTAQCRGSDDYYTPMSPYTMENVVQRGDECVLVDQNHQQLENHNYLPMQPAQHQKSSGQETVNIPEAYITMSRGKGLNSPDGYVEAHTHQSNRAYHMAPRPHSCEQESHSRFSSSMTSASSHMHTQKQDPHCSNWSPRFPKSSHNRSGILHVQKDLPYMTVLGSGDTGYIGMQDHHHSRPLSYDQKNYKKL